MRGNQKGITLISLAITIAVILILAAIGVTAAMSIINTGRFQELATNMNLIRARAKVDIFKYNSDNTSIDLVGTKADSNTIADIQNIAGGTITDANLVYKLDQEDLNEIGVKNFRLKSGEYIAVDYADEDVEIYYLPRGFEYNNRAYYKLSEILQIDINEEI